jgi:ATP-dependent Lhr-like helicase
LDALWDLVWAGEVTNDNPGVLRAFLGSRTGRQSHRSRIARLRSRRPSVPRAAGRWSRLAPPRGAPPTPAERALARAEQLLARHGVLPRAAILAEEVPGGVATLYPVLRALEEAGRIRRGYFVAGRGGSQFAHPGALERLRARREPGDEPQAAVLAATDPANPYGVALPWPRWEGARLARAAGGHVALVDGVLVAVLGKGEREITTFLPEDEPGRSRTARALALSLAGWAARTGRSGLGWGAPDGRGLAESPLAPYLLEAGFTRSGPGFRLVAVAPPGTPDLPLAEG